MTLVLVALLALVTLAGCGSGGGSGGSGGSGSDSGANAGTTARSGSQRHSHSARSVSPLIPPTGAPAHSVRVPVLTYHRIAPLSAIGVTDLKVEPTNFLAELSALREGGYHSITQTQLFDALYHRRSLPAKPILISVDDGYVDDITRVLPALKRSHMVATFFVITGRMTEPGFLTAHQIRVLDHAGMDIGDHTVHHVDLRLLSHDELRRETAGSRATLEHVLGHSVYAFAYPFGDYNGNVIAAVRAAGFTMAYTTAGGITQSTTAPLTMPRVHVGRAETPSGLLALLGGA